MPLPFLYRLNTLHSPRTTTPAIRRTARTRTHPRGHPHAPERTLALTLTHPNATPPVANPSFCRICATILLKEVPMNTHINKEYMLKKPATFRALALSIGVSGRTIERALRALQDKQIVQRMGTRRTGSWLVLR